MIKATNLVKTYTAGKQAFDALSDVSISIKQGETVAIIGKSGSGKSTLMHILSGMDTPTSGEVEFLGTRLTALKNIKLDEFRNKNIGFIFQSFFTIPNETVFENVSLPIKISGKHPKEFRSKIVNILKSVDLEEKIAEKAVNLSGGQKQRVCIARALVNSPSVIFADEPTGNLDSETGLQIQSLLFSLAKENGTTLIIVTHDKELAEKCDRQIILKDGKIIKS